MHYQDNRRQQKTVSRSPRRNSPLNNASIRPPLHTKQMIRINNERKSTEEGIIKIENRIKKLVREEQKI